MREWIGDCWMCGKKLYCENGFFNGIQEQGKLFCFFCWEEEGE